MNANLINEIIDKGEDIGQSVFTDLIIKNIIVKLSLTVGGFPAMLLAKLLGFVLDKWVFPEITAFKISHPQYWINQKAGKIYLKKLDGIDENTSLDDTIDIINGY